MQNYKNGNAIRRAEETAIDSSRTNQQSASLLLGRTNKVCLTQQDYRELSIEILVRPAVIRAATYLFPVLYTITRVGCIARMP